MKSAMILLREPNRYVQLAFLTTAYILGEMTHWLPGVVSRDMARELEYGDLACYDNNTFNGTFNPNITCGDIEGEIE